jgi:MFS family permease
VPGFTSIPLLSILRGDAGRVILAKGLRAIGDGFVSILLPAYLLALGHTPLLVGVLTTATLLGSATLTLLAGSATARFGLRKPLLWSALLMTATGLGFSGVDSFWPLLVIAFVGTINPSTGDVSIFLPLEQSLLSRSVSVANRTQAFAYFSLAGSLMGAVGTLGAALPGYLSNAWSVPPLAAMRAMFLLYAGLGVLTALLYRGVREPGGAQTGSEPAETHSALGPSKRNVYKLTALFSADAFGGGFLVQSLIAVWLFRAFDLPVATAAQTFFGTNLFAAASFLVAVPIAKRFGLVNTMVFTHLPSSLILFAIPFVPQLGWVIALLMARSFLSQMDVPTRTSYVMAVVTPPERAAAASLTAVPRSLAATIGPVIAGYLLTLSSFAWPLLIGGAIKVAYDVALLGMFRSVRPEEERK